MCAAGQKMALCSTEQDPGRDTDAMAAPLCMVRAAKIPRLCHAKMQLVPTLFVKSFDGDMLVTSNILQPFPPITVYVRVLVSFTSV